ncbi:MAG: hypothetical protein U1E47_02425 [Rivihabitans pingtungensis]
MSADGQILGSYLHGLFDHPEAGQALLRWAGLGDAQQVDLAALREASLERLADACQPCISACAAWIGKTTWQTWPVAATAHLDLKVFSDSAMNDKNLSS